MFLRKYYENGRIASISQLHMDRLIEIAVDVLDTSGQLATRKIHVELMGKYSNVIFTEDGVIIEAPVSYTHLVQDVRVFSHRQGQRFVGFLDLIRCRMSRTVIGDSSRLDDQIAVVVIRICLLYTSSDTAAA